MTKVRLLITLSLGTMLFASCEKEVEENIALQSVARLSAITAELPGNWQLAAYRGAVPALNTIDTRVTDAFTMLSDCEKDNLLHFEATGELTQLPGADVCDLDSDTPAKAGSWVLKADEQLLTLSLREAKEYQITALTASTLTLRSVVAAGEPYNIYTELEYTR